MTMLVCGSCGAENKGIAKFCARCGKAIESATPSPEPVISVTTAPDTDIEVLLPNRPWAGEIPAPAENPAEAESATEVCDLSAEAEAALEESGSEVAEAAIAPVESEVEVAAKSFPLKTLLMFAIPGVAIMLTAVIVAASVIIGGSIYGKTQDLFFVEGNGETIIIYDNGRTAKISGDYVSSQISLDGSRGALLVQDGSAKVLYYVTGSGRPVRVPGDVEDFLLADSGRALVFWTELREDKADLRLFNGRSATTIETAVPFTSVLGAGSRYGARSTTAISPDGRTVFYIGQSVTTTAGELSTTAYISTRGGSGVMFEHRDIFPVAISDRGKYIYYVRYATGSVTGNTLRVRKGRTGESISLGETDGIASFFFNRNYTQIAFGSSERAFLSIRGGEREQIANTSSFMFIVPEFAQIRWCGGAFVYGFDDFRGKVFITESGASLLTRRLLSERLSNGANLSSDVTMSSDGKRLFFLTDGNLRTVSATNPNNHEFTIIRNVESYTAAGKYVYFVNRHHELHRAPIREDAVSTLVSNNIRASSISSSGQGAVFFMSNDNDNRFFCTVNTKRNIIGNNIRQNYAVGNNNVVFFLEMGGDLFEVHGCTGRGKNSKRIAGDIGRNSLIHGNIRASG